MTPTPDAINERYEIVRELGHGGMGKVYLVRDRDREGQLLALKTLLPAVTNRLAMASFREEFAELAKLRHPHVAAAYDFGRISGTSEYYFTTEYIQGVDLAEATRESPADDFLNITAQLLRALEFVHSHGLLHNDLKPVNVLVAAPAGAGPGSADTMERLESLAYGRSGQVKLIDFGLISREHVAWNHVVGTLRYISPERIRKAAADRRSDLYSLGAVLYALLARRPPFTAEDRRELLECHLSVRPPPLEAFRPDVAPALRDLVHRLLEKKPEDRFQSAAEALAHLSPIVPGERPAAAEATGAGRGSPDGQPLAAGDLLHRDEELAALRHAYDAAAAGGAEGHALLIEGKPGMGKTRLVEELHGHVQVSGGTFVTLSGHQVEGDLQPVLEELLAGLRTSGVSGLEEVRRKLLDRAERDSTALGDALERLVFWYAERSPLLLHLDDFHRASQTVRRFALELVLSAESGNPERPCRLLVVISRVPGGTAGDLGLSGLRRLQLEPFAPEESARFLQRTFGQDDIPRQVMDALLSAAGGNPLFLLELANHLVRDGQVSFAGARWAFPESLEGVSLPESLSHLLRQKLAGLEPSRLEVLTWVAVAGGPLPHGVLARCARLGGDDFRAALVELTREKLLLARSTPGGATEYILGYAGFRDLLLARLDPETLESSHQRIAQNVEEEYPDWKDRADVLARHWRLSGNHAGFLRFAPRAAELLRARGDLETAVEYHERLAEAMPDSAVAKKIACLSRLSELHEFLWNLDACRKDILELQELGRGLLKPADRALLLRRLGCVELASFRYADAEAFLARAEEAAPGAGSVASAAVEAPRAAALWFLRQQKSALDRLQRCEEVLQGPPPEEGRERMLFLAAANHTANLLQTLGALPKAAERYARNLELLAATEEAQARAATLCSLGAVLLELGRYEEGGEHLESALRLGKELGDRRVLSRARERLGDHYLFFGRFPEALQITQVALQDAQELENTSAMASACCTLGRLHEYAGERREARQLLHRAATLHGQSGDIAGLGSSRIELARFHLRELDLEGARAELDAAAAEGGRYRLPLLETQRAAWNFLLDWLRGGVGGEAELEALSESFLRYGYRRRLLEFRLEATEVAIERGELELAGSLLQELAAEAPVAAGGRSPLAPDLGYLRGLLALRGGRAEEAGDLLAAARRGAREARKLRLTERCQAVLEESAVEA